MSARLSMVSKSLSYYLRHKPEELKLTVEVGGWVSVDQLLAKLEICGTEVTLDELKEVVATSDKKRFSFDEEKRLIRANQGHSFPVDLQLKAVKPPVVLYHGTAEKNLDSILKEGIKKMDRTHVHLSEDPETAKKVGSRHGSPVVLAVSAELMADSGCEFYVSENGVWLTDFVPFEFLCVLSQGWID